MSDISDYAGRLGIDPEEFLRVLREIVEDRERRKDLLLDCGVCGRPLVADPDVYGTAWPDVDDPKCVGCRTDSLIAARRLGKETE